MRAPSGIEPEAARACYFEIIRRKVRHVDHAWIILGLIAGFIASKIVNKQAEGFFLDIVLGIVGALVGGFIFTAVGASGITGFNLYSLVVAVIAAIVVLLIYHAIGGRRAY